MNEQLKELTLINFKKNLNNLKGNDLKCALRDTDNNEAFINWIGDAINESCEELNLNENEIQEVYDDESGFYDDDCYDYIDELRGCN